MAASSTFCEKVSYMKKKNEDLGKALATEKAKSAGLELTVDQQRQEMEQMRHDMEQITKEKETLEKGLEDYRQMISEREAEIGHLTKRIKNKDSKIFKLKTDYDKSTAHYLSKLKKKDLRIGEINNELAERNNELEETIVKFEK
jgi:chromosome segregation ATPase